VTVEAVESSLQTLVDTSGAKVGFGLVFGLVLGINGASGAFGAAGRALNKVYGVDEDRGFVRRKALDLAWTLALILLSIVAMGSVFLGGQIADDLFGTIGLGSTAAAIWTYARWLVALVAMMVIFAIIYAFAPDLEHRRFRWISPGAALAVVIWIVASALFFVYVSNVNDYGATYGAFAGAVILLLWLYITSLAFLLGGEVNGEIEREQVAGRGGPPPPSLPPQRATRTPRPAAARGRSCPPPRSTCAGRPGQPAHRPMCGSGATSKRPARTPLRPSPRARRAGAGTSPAVYRALTGSPGRSRKAWATSQPAWPPSSAASA
jgi:membrane protein